MKKLTKAEEEIMHYVWELGEATTRMIYEHMPDPKTPQSTISSIIRIIEGKGFVDHKAIGRTHLYFPLISKDQYSKGSIQSIARKYFSDSMPDLVNFLVKEEQVDLDELREILNKNKDN